MGENLLIFELSFKGLKIELVTIFAYQRLLQTNAVRLFFKLESSSWSQKKAQMVRNLKMGKSDKSIFSHFPPILQALLTLTPTWIYTFSY